MSDRLCEKCALEVNHISQCETDGHWRHHAGCCPDGEET